MSLGTIFTAAPSARAATAAEIDQKSRAALQELCAKSPTARRLGHVCHPFFAIIFLSASIAVAGTESYDYKEAPPPPPPQSWCVTPPDTEFRIGIPGWITGLQGDFGVRGVVTEQDVKFTDILKRLDMIAVGSLYARYHRWEIFADGQYMKISDTATLPGLLFDTAHVGLKSAFAEAFVGYRLLNCQSVVLSIFAGARYNY